MNSFDSDDQRKAFFAQNKRNKINHNSITNGSIRSNESSKDINNKFLKRKNTFLTETGRIIKKYIAFSPSSSEATEWWTSNTLDGVKKRLLECDATRKNTIKNLGNGKYVIGDIEIYNVKLHPKAIEGLE